MDTADLPRRWPLALIAAPAAVAVWSGWVGLGGLCGFGVIHPLPGIWAALRLNTAITLPVGVEAYGAYALGAWLAPGAPEQARVFARRSAVGALALGMAGQIVYHLLAAAHATRAPWPVVVLVSCMPVVTLGFGAALTHLLRPAPRTGQARTGAPGTDRATPHVSSATPQGTGAALPAPAERAGHGVPASSNGESPRAPRPPRAGTGRAALVAELAEEIRAGQATGTQWRPDYAALMARTGYRRSWCEKAVRAARRAAGEPAGAADGPVPAPAAGQAGTDAAEPAAAGLATNGASRTGVLPLRGSEAA